MVICSCNVVTDQMIKEYMEKHEGKLPSANAIFQALGKETMCATCSRNVKCEIRKHKKGG